MRKLRLIILAGVALAATALIPAGTAIAQTNAPAPVNNGQATPQGPAAQPFAAQARAAGYSTAQTAPLQEQVDQYLAAVGGRQTAINKVEFDGGTVLLPLPGETRAREVGAAVPANCPRGSFCVYRNAGFSGPQVTRSKCGFDNGLDMGWRTVGSWYNNQTGGARATFYWFDTHLMRERVWTVTGTAPDNRVKYDWNHGPVNHVQACGAPFS